MTKIFLVRHGEAEGNLYRRSQGHWDMPLTERGRQQTAALARRFENIALDAVYASDLSRAMDTARACAQGLPVTAEPRLREMGTGVWEGKSWGNIAEEWPEELEHFCFAPHLFSVPGGESLETVQERMMSVLREMAERHEGGTVLAASHGMSIRTVLAAVMDIPPERVREVKNAENTAVALLTWENGRFTVDYYNDASHLPPELRTEGKKNWWGKDGLSESNLRFEPFQPERERRRFLACYQDAWRTAHGSLLGFDEGTCWLGASYRAAQSPEALQSVWKGRDFAGYVALDEQRGEHLGYGWVSFLYLKEEFRGQGLGVQLIGAAATRFRRLGRRSLRLCTAPKNPALGFYEHMGFVRCGTEPGALEDLIRLEKEL